MGMAAAAAAIPWKFDLRRGFAFSRAYAFSQTPILRKFVDSLPGLTLANANNLGQYLTVMTPNDPGNLYPGSDYYHMVASQLYPTGAYPTCPAPPPFGATPRTAERETRPKSTLVG